jgi:hypothetical protein
MSYWLCLERLSIFLISFKPLLVFEQEFVLLVEIFCGGFG